MKPYKIKYDRKKYHFRKAMKDCLLDKGEMTDLERLHLTRKYDPLTREKDQNTDFHKYYYENFSLHMEPMYKEFVNDVIKSHFGLTEIIYQKIPTFRVHLVDNLGVGEWHKDKQYNHGTSEINIWLPFTDAYETNSIWIESEEDKGDFEPYTVVYGEVLIFDGANLMHGNKINKTMNTRVSVDFRIVDPAKFIPSDKGSINTNSKFDIGGYFEKI